MNRVFTLEFKNGKLQHYDVDLWEIFIGQNLICLECMYDDRKYWFDKEDIKYIETDYE